MANALTVPRPRPAGLPPLGTPITPAPTSTPPLPLAPGVPEFGATTPAPEDPNPLPPAVGGGEPEDTGAEPTAPAAPARPASQTTTSSLVQTPAVKAARAGLDAAEKEQQTVDALDQTALDKTKSATTAASTVEKLELDEAAAEEDRRRELAAGQAREARLRYGQVKAKADADAEELKKASRSKDTFFTVAGSDGEKKDWGKSIGWAIAIMAGSQHSSGRNEALGMLQRSMDTWAAEKQANLDRLERMAEKSGGQLSRFWQDFGAESKARTDLEIAAGYEGQADRLAELREKRKGAIDAEAESKFATAEAEMRRKAADRRERAAQTRFDVETKLAPQQSTTIEKPATGGPGAGAYDGDARLVRDPFTGQPIGLTSGKRETSPEGAKIREQLSNARPLVDQIEELQELVKQTDGWDRINPKSKRRLAIEGKVNVLVNPLTQILGGGVAQEAEARRQIETASVGFWRGKDTAMENLNSLKNFVRDQANNRARTAVVTAIPGAGAGGEPAARPAAGSPAVGQMGTSRTGRPMKWNGKAWEYAD